MCCGRRRWAERGGECIIGVIIDSVLPYTLIRAAHCTW